MLLFGLSKEREEQKKVVKTEFPVGGEVKKEHCRKAVMGQDGRMSSLGFI